MRSGDSPGKAGNRRVSAFVGATGLVSSPGFSGLFGPEPVEGEGGDDEAGRRRRRLRRLGWGVGSVISGKVPVSCGEPRPQAIRQAAGGIELPAAEGVPINLSSDRFRQLPCDNLRFSSLGENFLLASSRKKGRIRATSNW